MRIKVEAKIRKPKNGKVSCKNEVIEKMIKSLGKLVIDYLWKSCDMALKCIVELIE